MRVCLPALLLAFAALLAPCTARELLVVTYGDAGQTSLSWAEGLLPDSEKGSPDLPMDEPPLVSVVLVSKHHYRHAAEPPQAWLPRQGLPLAEAGASACRRPLAVMRMPLRY